MTERINKQVWSLSCLVAFCGIARHWKTHFAPGNRGFAARAYACFETVAVDAHAFRSSPEPVQKLGRPILALRIKSVQTAAAMLIAPVPWN